MRVFWKSSCSPRVVLTLSVATVLLIGYSGAQEGRDREQPVARAEGDRPLERRESRERPEYDRAEPAQRERGERPTERDVLKKQIEVLKDAHHGLLEAEKKDAAEVLQRAIRAREVMLEGRRDDEANMIRERAPSREQLAEILESAAGLWRELGNQDKAAAVGRIAGEFAARTRDGDARRERVEDRPREGAEDQPRERAERMTEREMVLQWIDVMKTAMPALREGE